MNKCVILSSILFSLVLFLGNAGTAADGGPSQGGPSLGASLSAAPRSPQQGPAAAGSLTTLFAQNNYWVGNTFDITPTKDIIITGIDCNIGPGYGPATVLVYYRTGTSFGFENNAAGWSVLSSGSGTAAGVNNPTYFALSGASGMTFLAGQTYGIYVYVTSYAYHKCYYTNGPNTVFSNSDLSLLTNSGQGAPGFSAFQSQRQWNGTLYYKDPGSGLPVVNILVNHVGSTVKIYPGQWALIEFALKANVSGGTPGDVWVALKSPFGYFTYDRQGPFSGWHFGLGMAYFTGPLGDMNGTAFNGPLGMGRYSAYIGIDSKANGVLNLNSIVALDRVDFEFAAPPPVYSWDDGSAEELLGYQNGGEVCWMQKFDAFTGGETITNVQCLFGSVANPGIAPGNGTACEVFVWDDPTDDGDPSDCVLLTKESVSVQQVDTGNYNVFQLAAPVQVKKEFYVGCRMPHTAAERCVPIDSSSPYASGSAFTCGTTTPPFDPAHLTNNEFPPAEFFNFSCIRAGY